MSMPRLGQNSVLIDSRQTSPFVLWAKKNTYNESSGVLAASASSRPYSTQGQQVEFLPEILRTTKREVGIAGSTM